MRCTTPLTENAAATIQGPYEELHTKARRRPLVISTAAPYVSGAPAGTRRRIRGLTADREVLRPNPTEAPEHARRCRRPLVNCLKPGEYPTRGMRQELNETLGPGAYRHRRRPCSSARRT